MGYCNRGNGACVCRDIFEGPACDRLACPTDDLGVSCSGHGMCATTGWFLFSAFFCRCLFSSRPVARVGRLEDHVRGLLRCSCLPGSCCQASDGATHTDELRFAYDFLLPVGTPVLAPHHAL